MLQDEGGGDSAGMELVSECEHMGHILALYLQSRGDFIIVGDLMKSMSLLVYKPVERVLEEIARDYNANWMTAVDMLDDDVFIGAESSFNLFTVRKNGDAATDEERRRLETCGQ
jgi:DNA damage-binding protein 1